MVRAEEGDPSCWRVGLAGFDFQVQPERELTCTLRNATRLIEVLGTIVWEDRSGSPAGDTQQIG